MAVSMGWNTRERRRAARVFTEIAGVFITPLVYGNTGAQERAARRTPARMAPMPEKASPDRQGRLHTPDLVWVYGAHGLIHAYMFVFPVILALVKEEFGTGWFALGVLATASQMAFGLGALPAGYFTDRLGARTVLFVSLVGSGLAAVGAGFSNSLLTLAAALVLMGGFGALYHPSALTLLTLVRPGSGRVLGMHGVGGSLGMVVSPLAVAGVAGVTSWRGAFLAVGVFGILYALVSRGWLPSPESGTRRLQNRGAPAAAASGHSPGESVPGSEAKHTDLRTLLLVYVIVMVLGFIYNGYIAYLPSYMSDRSPDILSGVVAGGALSTVVLLFGMFGQWFGGRLVDGPGPLRSYGVIMVLSAGTVAAMGLVTGWFLVAVAAVFSIVLFAGQPMGNTLVANYTSEFRRGVAYGVSFTLAFGVGSLAGGAMGYVADWAGLNAVYLGLGVSGIPGVAAAMALIVTRLSPRHA